MNLFDDNLRSAVQPTNLTKKLTLNGETKAYLVYRVNLEKLFYNDQNDRIATWINQYKAENGNDVFSKFTMQEYNNVIENFIVQSNPAAIEKTQNNIELVGQREAGVVLSSGRIVDGNRRFTCLRRLAQDNPEFNWFETVILNETLKNNKKEIKMLELAIQHGEEKKVDYNPIDRLVGIYQDIMKTELLTVEEYAESTNETVNKVKERMEHAQLLVDFLEYVRMPEQFYIAREYQVVSVITDMTPLLKKCKKDSDRTALKETVYNNILMQTIGDSRKFIRSISAMMENGIFATYIKRQTEISKKINEKLDMNTPNNLDELQQFADENNDIADELKNNLDTSLLKAKKRETKSRPSQSVSKSFTMLKDVDTRVFDTLNDAERTKLMGDITKLSEKVNSIKAELTGEEIVPSAPAVKSEPVIFSVAEAINTPLADVGVAEITPLPVCIGGSYKIAARHIEEPMINCTDLNKPVTNLTFSLNFRLDEAQDFQNKQASYQIFFINSNDEAVSQAAELTLKSGQTASANFALSSAVSKEEYCFLAIKSVKDADDTLQQKIPFKIAMTFTADFGI